MNKYEIFMFEKGFDINNRRKLIASFFNEGSSEIQEGYNFDAIVVDDDAEKSYGWALEYFNSTLRPDGRRRFMHSAVWEDEVKEE